MSRPLLQAFVLAALAGCSSASEQAGGDASARDASDSGAAPRDAATADEPVAKCIVSGQVTDMNEEPWSGATVQVCSESLCTLGKAPAGSFAVEVPCGGRYHVIARQGAADSRAGSAGLGVIGSDVTSDVALTAPVRIPETGAPTPLSSGAQQVDVTAELTLAFDPADVAYYGDASIAAVRVPDAKWPAFTVPGKTILAMWALNPWGTSLHPSKAIAVTVKNVFGLAAGDAVSVYPVSESTASLLAPTAAAVTSDGTAITGATVDRITWIVMAR